MIQHNKIIFYFNKINKKYRDKLKKFDNMYNSILLSESNIGQKEKEKEEEKEKDKKIEKEKEELNISSPAIYFREKKPNNTLIQVVEKTDYDKLYKIHEKLIKKKKSQMKN